VSQVEPFVDVTAPPATRLTHMTAPTLFAAAPSTSPAQDAGAADTEHGPEHVEQLAAQLAVLNERLAVATAQRDAYREALVKIRLAMHSMPGL
jgi:hypothetical protein